MKIKLRGKILIPLLIFYTLSLGFTGWHIYSESKQSLTEAITQTLTVQARSVMDGLENSAQNILLDVQGICNIPPVMSLFRNERSKTSPQFIAAQEELIYSMTNRSQVKNNNYVSIDILSRDGTILASNMVETISTNMNDEEARQRVIEQKKSFVGHAFTREANITLIPFYAPVVLDGQVVGLVRAVVNFTPLSTVSVAPVRIGEHGYAFVSNNLGEVLDHPEARFIMAPVKATDLTPKMASMRNGSLNYTWNNADWLAVFATGKLTNWTAIVKVDRSEVFAPITFLRNQIGLISVASLVLFTLLIVFIGNYIVHMLLKTIDYAKEVSAGNITKDLDLHSNDEVGTLADALRTMVTSLRTMIAQGEENQEELKRISQLKTNFLANMSHEIRTPMNAIVGITELILREETSPKVHKDALTIKQACQNLLGIINDILDISKVESGKLEIIPVRYLFASLLNDVITMAKMRLEGKLVSFTVNIDSELPNELIGDEIRLRQILINLLSNATKFTHNGNIHFTVRGECKGDTILLVFSIQDTGIGIRQEDIGKLFDTFSQMDTRKNRSIQGTGLGLAISKNLCELMHGSITVESVYGEGSEFTATIPQAIVDYKPLAQVDHPENKRCLVFEQREQYSQSLMESMHNLHLAATLCHTCEEVTAALAAGTFQFAFVAAPLFEQAKPLFAEHPDTRLVLMSDLGDKNISQNQLGLVLPIHTLQIADIVNSENTSLLYSEKQQESLYFTAPEARVLIVDDIALNLLIAEALLAPYNMHVDTVDNSAEAIKMIRENRYDLVFMDHMMPGKDGIDTTREVRGLEGEYFTTLPIIALTANAISGVREMFLHAGLNDFIAKPVETQKLHSILTQWLPQEKLVRKAKP
ncbi:ATP-binding protein [Desulfovibrio cuneatus]|uniref:ATP-binding protein n=1 Tax=Desulfovibrio cuneatus TaxID=159728 RepID=UPI0003FBEB0E|nr:ATP-binding protein [Desulfovibrio cuneatus]